MKGMNLVNEWETQRNANELVIGLIYYLGNSCFEIRDELIITNSNELIWLIEKWPIIIRSIHHLFKIVNK